MLGRITVVMVTSEAAGGGSAARDATGDPSPGRRGPLSPEDRSDKTRGCIHAIGVLDGDGAVCLGCGARIPADGRETMRLRYL